MSKNIVQAYIDIKGQLLIFITGISGCGKIQLAKNIARDFKLKIIDQFYYHKKDYNQKILLPNGKQIKNWYSDDATDWDKLNSDINKFKSKGLIVIGSSLPDKKIEAKKDYHIHLNISKQICMEKRREFISKNKNKYPKEYLQINSPEEKLKMNQLIYPYFLKSTSESQINKFININDLSDSQIYDKSFQYLIDFIKKELHQNGSSYNPTENNCSNLLPKPTKILRKTAPSNKCNLTFRGTLNPYPIPSYDDNLNMVQKLTHDPNKKIKYIYY